jgi:hypothetical protein
MFIRYIKYILIFTLVVHILHDTWVINTMEARVNARLVGIDGPRINGRLDSMQYLLARMAKELEASQAAQKAAVNSDMASANKLAPNDLIVPHWPEDKK